MHCIYKSTNKINGKCYIGFSNNLPRRIYSHKRAALKLGIVTKFYNAIRRHGWESFDWEIIYLSVDRDYTLKIIEPLLIKEFDSINSGYNQTKGGEQGPILYGKDNGMYGKTHSNQAKKIMSEAASIRAKGKSYETRYGTEKAKKLKLLRSEMFCNIGKKSIGSKNHYYDHTVYNFRNNRTKQT